MLGSDQWRTKFTDLVYSVNQNSQYRFAFPDHFHCAKLFAGSGLSADVAEKFAKAVLDCVAQHSLFCFCARNVERRFEYSEQATYVMHLRAAAELALVKLAELPGEYTSLDIYVAQRTTWETTHADSGRQARDYMMYLCPLLQEQLLAGDGLGSVLARRLDERRAFRVLSAVGTNPGIAAADFVCNRAYHGIRPDKFHETKPASSLGSTNQKPLLHQANELLKYGQFAAAFDFAHSLLPRTDREKFLERLFAALEQESAWDVLERALPGLLAEARRRITLRTQIEGARKEALELLERLVKIADKSLNSQKEPKVRTTWVSVQVDALVDLSTCYNHVGETAKQNAIDKKLIAHLELNSRELDSSYANRQETILDLRNRNLNQLFNNYQFEEVVSQFDSLVEERQKRIPPAQSDPLLGQMLGSMGQACGFLARTNPDWFLLALDYFQQSVKHFSPGTRFHEMSVNFLAALHWQKEDNSSALAALQLYPQRPAPDSQQLAADFSKHLKAPSTDVFIAVLYAKITAALVEIKVPVCRSGLSEATRYWNQRVTNEHPHELLLKWLGYLHFLMGNSSEAFELWRKAVSICDKMQFTVQTIGLSILVLETNAHAQCGREADFQKHLKEVGSRASELCKQSVAFRNYLNGFGGVEGLMTLSSARTPGSLKKIARLLPFTYS